MKKKRGLLLDNNDESMVSPLVDVVFNLMITMFVFLMIYMAVITPKDDNALSFIGDRNLPETSFYKKYYSNIPVSGGSGKYTFIFADNINKLTIKNDDQNKKIFNSSSFEKKDSAIWDGLKKNGYMDLNTKNGMIQAKFLRNKRKKSVLCSFDVVVIDNIKTKSLQLDSAETFGDACLYFYQEPKTLQPSNNSSLTDQTQDEPENISNTVNCHYAIRDNFKIHIKPKKIPFDPKKNPLKMILPKTLNATVDIPFKANISLMGGIEPYYLEIVKNKLNRWIKYNKKTCELYGTPTKAYESKLKIELRDSQTESRRAAKLNRNNPGKPFIVEEINIIVKDLIPLKASLSIPEYGRVNTMLKSAIITEGGYGTLTFSSEKLPPGIAINSETGEIKGTLKKEGLFSIVIAIKDENPNQKPYKLSIPKWSVIPEMPKPEIIGSNK